MFTIIEPKVKKRKKNSTNIDESEEENKSDDDLSLDDPNNNSSIHGFLSPRTSENNDRRVALVESPTSSPIGKKDVHYIIMCNLLLGNYKFQYLIGNAGMKKTPTVFSTSSDAGDRQVSDVESGSSSTSSQNG